MPELPEVEVVRRDLDDALRGRRIVGVAVTGARSVRRHPPEELDRALQGARIQRVGRHGKFLLVHLEGGDVLIVHLRMSGQLRLAASPHDPSPRHCHVRLAFDDGRELRFVDPRTFGELFVTTPDVPELAALGVDALDPALTKARLGHLVSARRGRLKALLLDQHVVAGLGNVYSDEIQHRAGLRGDRPGTSLTAADVARLHRALRSTLREAITYRGSSLADEQYVDLQGNLGAFQQRHRVYGREGQRCPRCRSLVVRERLAGRSHYSCPGCQA